MTLLLVGLLGAAIAVTQLFWAGARPVYSYPGYALIALAGLLSVLLFRSRRVSPSGWCTAVAVVFAAYVIIRTFTSPVAELARVDLHAALSSLIVYLIFAAYITQPGDRMVFFGAMLVLIVPNFAVGLIHFAREPSFTLFGYPRYGYGSRASGLFGCPNHLAGFLEMAAGAGFALAFWSRLKLVPKILCGYLALAALALLLLTGSRGGYLSAAAVILVFVGLTVWLVMVLAPHYLVRTLVALGIVATLCGGLLLFALQRSEMLMERGTRLTTGQDVRPLYWQAAIKQFQDAPILGAGARTYTYYGRMYRHPARQSDAVYVHNDYLQLASEYGLVGFFLGIGLLLSHGVAGLISMGRIIRERLLATTGVLSNALAVQLAALCGLAGIAVHTVFDWNLHIPANAMLVSALLGMLANPGIVPKERSPKRRNQRGVLGRALIPATSAALIAVVTPVAEADFFRERARLEFTYGEPAKAAVLARRAMEQDPQNSEAAQILGESRRRLAFDAEDPRLQQLMLESAAVALREAARRHPFDVRNWLKLGRTYDRLGHFDLAAAAHQNSLQLDPNLYMVHEFLGLHYHLQGEFAAAEEAYRKALSLGPAYGSRAGLEELEKNRKQLQTEEGGVVPGPPADQLEATRTAPDAEVQPATP